jgi:hypothetical protein
MPFGNRPGGDRDGAEDSRESDTATGESAAQVLACPIEPAAERVPAAA